MPPVILITRPEPYGAEFAATLRTLPGGDLPTILSPALQIGALGTVPDLGAYRWLIFTSRNGVRYFAGASARRDIPVYAVGDATADEARRAGMEAISCGGDARDLVARIIADGARGPMLHLRGAHTAADIAGVLTAAGIKTDEAILYSQRSAPLTDAARACLMGDAPVIAPVFSPRSAAALFNDVPTTAPVVVLAISDAAATCIPEGAAREVIIADHPDMAAMLRAWPQALSAAYRLEGTIRAE
ncbi:uroporphyrinogen-III synthase [Roseovarius arcticus]|uniref:uroporphyrinogen-III synthase n=1 Tax=Roseovarius arcticus TaxID=2547404 RepID=UPI001485E090|nr:uroporphyrinogen-III synthase [Roseovarius arcticus]